MRISVLLVAVLEIAAAAGKAAFILPTHSRPQRPPRTSVRAAWDGVDRFKSLISSIGGNGEEQTDVLVVGGGLTGCSLGWSLFKKGADVLVTEARDKVGGNIISRTDGKFIWEEGPNTFQPNDAILRLATDVGLKDQLVLADGSQPRWVFWEEELYKLPGGLGDLPTFNLLSWPGKIRAGLGALGFVPPKPTEEESIREFVSRHLGEEAFMKLIDPFVSGVYAGDPTNLSMRAALKRIYNLQEMGGPGLLDGAILRLRQRAQERKENPPDADLPEVKPGQLGSFRDGLKMLCEAVEKRMGPQRVRTSWTVDKIERLPDGGFRAIFNTPFGTRIVNAKALAVTTPAAATAKLLKDMVPQVERYEEIAYPPVAAVALAYPSSSMRRRFYGFGHLIPRANKIRTLGTIWTSSLFPYRSPDGMELTNSYIGGRQDEDINKLTPKQIAEQVHQDIKRILLKDDAPPPRVLGVKVWPRAIPQFEKGHLELLAEAEEGIAQVPGLFVGGNFKCGVAIGDCVEYGQTTADEMIAFIESSSGSMAG
ncbi:unnamed protein product [Vitrella brassicaformis CCMP3155]|uniref:Protoporphyrinogen oxidase n=1 Tax=Vitrella brassicaformis (strain CCMP3155) TaxID=1169540 RepID=A0A0G4GGJ5_VITBC|nr:unnamed protein product [Vitrella brassicaformis CCMP3155]|eukprot:CEM28741.1 unnamed protein product [Vitrella brassicaformis CCMP3155]